MRFRLVEEPTDKKVVEWPPSRKTLSEYNKLDTTDTQRQFVEERIFPHKIFKNLYGVQPIIHDCIQKFGLDPNRNFFLDFVANLRVPMPNNKSRPKLQYIYDSYLNKKVDIRMPVLQNPSLYDRSDRDFQYTVNAFHLMSDLKRAKAYIKDTTVINIDEFFADGNDPRTSTIKPAGRDGEEGDTIYNVIEKWADNNEYSPEEIANNKRRQEEEEKDKEKENGKGTQQTPTKVEWTYEFFRESLEKVFANSGKFNLKLKNKNDYLERAFVTFKLSSIVPQETDNKVYKKEASAVKDNDVTKFGDPHNVDEPIHMSLRDANKLVNGVYVFHKFVPLDDKTSSYYKQIANKNLGYLKRHLNNVNPNNDNDVHTHLQSIVDAISELSGISNK